jgi:hypothetical protein
MSPHGPETTVMPKLGWMLDQGHRSKALAPKRKPARAMPTDSRKMTQAEADRVVADMMRRHEEKHPYKAKLGKMETRGPNQWQHIIVTTPMGHQREISISVRRGRDPKNSNTWRYRDLSTAGIKALAIKVAREGGNSDQWDNH